MVLTVFMLSIQGSLCNMHSSLSLKQMSSKSKYDAGIPNTVKVYRRHECKVLHIADLDLLGVFMLNALVSQQKNPRLIVPQHCCCTAGLMRLQPGPNVCS